ncbi:HlyD family secretion protein [Paenibacillus polymyxa]|uniref:HlyD family secretion protein n=1 Tax=Paenibacillus polymyxa TaxID=1406 RepID=UPI000D3214ED|nr:efflux RND transporter periplasmic adaptor subunit [Paenibacillus polymyxa]PTU46947.1 HlyD family secretion protein [Paenibacillus polymyxa]
MKAKKYAIYIVLIILIAVGIYALTALPRGSSSLSADESSSIPTAYVESDTLNASFKMAGRIDQMLVNEGDKVKKGQVIAHLESRELEDKVKQAQAALLAAKSNVSKAKASVLQAQAGVGQAQATVSAAQAKKSQGTTAVSVTAEASSSQIEQAKAASNAAKAKLDALKSGARPQELEQLQASVKVAKETLDLTVKNLERAKKLQEAGAATQASLDQATLEHQQAVAKYNAESQKLDMAREGSRKEEITAAEAQYRQALAAVKEAQAGAGKVAVQQEDVKAAQASVEQAQSAVKAAQSTVEQAQSAVEGANAQVAQAEAALQEAQTYLSYTTLRASEDGIIKSKSLSLGEMASAGFPVYTIETSTQRWAKFYVPETSLNGLQAGDTVQIKLLSGGKELKGKVILLESAADFAIQKPSQSSGDKDVRSFGVKVALPDLAASVPTGSTVLFTGKGAQ